MLVTLRVYRIKATLARSCTTLFILNLWYLKLIDKFKRTLKCKWSLTQVQTLAQG